MKLLVIFLSTWLLPTICHSVCLKPYWGIPTSTCGGLSVNFNGYPCEFGIAQNSGDQIFGDEIVILQRPGLYPHIEVDSSGKKQLINGGVPQSVNMTEHLQKLEEEINDKIDADFAGIGIIKLIEDGSSLWKLLYDQKSTTMEYHRDASDALINSELVEDERKKLAKEQFGSAAKNYMERTLRRAKELRPKALWGYDDFPNCFEAWSIAYLSCTDKDRTENDSLDWFWKLQDFMMSWIYVHNYQDIDGASKRSGMRISEAKRIVHQYNPNAKIILRMDIHTLNGTTYLNKEVVSIMLRNMIDNDIDGVVLYDGATKLDSQASCLELRNHMTDVLGPQTKKDLDYANTIGKCGNETISCIELPGSIY
uniref:Hyaluronidase n=1 Tax=Meteorus pulchricornis TaxID=51522 RepID=H7CHK2_9HYME|nr:hyaluronidase [Meteorus pulchricornis]